MRSIAFPTLGIGALGYPTKAAVQGMVQSIKRFAHKHQAFLTDISIVVFSGSGDCATLQYVCGQMRTTLSLHDIPYRILSGNIIMIIRQIR